MKITKLQLGILMGVLLGMICINLVSAGSDNYICQPEWYCLNETTSVYRYSSCELGFFYCNYGCQDNRCINVLYDDNNTEQICPTQSCPSCNCGSSGGTRIVYVDRNNTIYKNNTIYLDKTCQENVCENQTSNLPIETQPEHLNWLQRFWNWIKRGKN